MVDRRTLYEDWKARREQLAGRPYRSGDRHAVEAQVLDYLIRRYRDTPEGARLARFPLTSDIYINHRAIAVLHHLGSGRIPAITTASEALVRVQSIVRRMLQASGNEATEIGNPDAISASDDATDLCRMRLCEGEPIARVLAIVKLGDIGTLDDIGLLSDLLALPPSDDEHPKERVAMVHSMQRLAGVTSERFDLSDVIPSPFPEQDVILSQSSQKEEAASPEQSADLRPEKINYSTRLDLFKMWCRSSW